MNATIFAQELPFLSVVSVSENIDGRRLAIINSCVLGVQDMDSQLQGIEVDANNLRELGLMGIFIPYTKSLYGVLAERRGFGYLIKSRREVHGTPAPGKLFEAFDAGHDTEGWRELSALPN